MKGVLPVYENENKTIQTLRAFNPEGARSRRGGLTCSGALAHPSSPGPLG